MESANDDAALTPRFPTTEDFLKVCRLLNEAGARYIVVGGWAIIHQGLGRTTEDIDILVECTPENFERVRTGLAGLPDGAAKELTFEDVSECLVVRVADEVVVDVMRLACGLDYAVAAPDIEWREVAGLSIPFANAQLLWKTKQTYRAKDELDRDFLRTLLSHRSGEPDTT
jgi:hypothetical protein